MSKTQPSLRKKKGGKSTPKPKPNVPYHRKPDNLSLDKWQFELRKQFAEKQNFEVNNMGQHEVFSDYQVFNSESKNTYKVAIRSAEEGLNFCSCMDFKTNQLGSCKHIEYVLFQINKTSRKKKILKQGYQPHYTSVYLQYGKERKVKIRYGIENENVFRNLSVNYFDEAGILKPEAYSRVDSFLQKAHALHPDFRCYTDALEFILEKREAQTRNEKVDRQLKQSDKFFNSIIKADLFPYQKQGIEFALRKSRCLLADDMGLGKTIQAIGAAEGMRKLYAISKVLIVCPTSLKYQWKSEIQKFTGSDLCVIEGNVREREKQYDNSSFYKICSYHVVGRDLDAINKAGFDLVILDEAQRIKNWQTVTAKNVKRVKSKHVMVLTGTPLENKLEELYSVVQMVDPHRLGALFRFVGEHQITDEVSGKIIGYKDLNKIGEVLNEILLRRHKRDVLKQLPSRMDKNLFVPMTERQWLYYNDAKEAVVKLVNKWMRFKFLNESDRQRMLINLNLMRMACNSTFIVDQETRHDTKIDELMSILEETFANSDDKVVVFSQWERMTRIVAMELDKRNIKYESLHGGVPGKAREKLFENFRNNPESKVFLSTDAGGVGLNLQSASLLINLDLPWNPAVLEQRIGRIHRMGQKKNVQIINLISKETIEEEMLAKLKFKSSMAMGVLDNGESTVFLGEGKFNELMKQVKDMTDKAVPPSNGFISETEEGNEITVVATEKSEPEAISPTQQMQLLDDDIPKATAENFSTNEANEASALIESGAGFFNKLLETLSDKSKTEKLMNTLVKTDEATGQTYLQIPVKNTAVVENGLKLLSQLFNEAGK